VNAKNNDLILNVESEKLPNFLVEKNMQSEQKKRYSNAIAKKKIFLGNFYYLSLRGMRKILLCCYIFPQKEEISNSLAAIPYFFIETVGKTHHHSIILLIPLTNGIPSINIITNSGNNS
jgi:hypothetical protein